jgi:enediyne biosynthesis protein E4
MSSRNVTLWDRRLVKGQKLIVWLSLATFLLVSVGSIARAQNSRDGMGSIALLDVTAASGIDFVHSNGTAGLGYLVEGILGGVVLLDYDSDGLTDIFFTNGAPLRGSKQPEGSLRHALYRNLGNMKFEDVTEKSKLIFHGYGVGAVAADYDNDLDPDLFISAFGKNVLFRNRGDGTFEDATEFAGVAGKDELSAGACFVDIDNDGWLDLFVASYVDFKYENHVPFPSKGQFLMAGPQYYPYLPDAMYRNRGDGTFEDISDASGVGRVKGPGMGVVALDYDEDGDSDIFVAQDGAPNLLFQNDGTGKFDEVALLSGVASNAEGKIAGSMGVDCGDYDGDGRLDLFVTNYQSEIPVLYRNLGGGLFEDASSKAKVPTSLFPHVNWGVALADFDNDGRKDVFIANGHFDRVELSGDRTSLKVANTILRNIGSAFVDESKTAGSGLAIVESSRGIGVDDLDNDGDLDVVVLNSNAAPSILMNETVSKNHWLQVELRGTKSNKGGVGAKVRIRHGGRQWIDEVRAGRGYQSHFGARLSYGLGAVELIEELEVVWPSGQVDAFRQVRTNQVLKIEEGSSTR